MSGRKIIDNVCNIFTLLSVIMLIYAGFIAMNEKRLGNLVAIEQMKITSITKRDDMENNDYLPKYTIEVQQNINGLDYTTYISRIPTGYTNRTKDDDKTAEYKVGDMAEVYINTSTMTDDDFRIIYNLSLFKSGEFGYVSTVPLVAALVCFLLGVARITRIIDFCKKHTIFLLVSLLFSIITSIIYFIWEISISQSTEMFKGLGEGILLNGALLAGILAYVIASICIIVSDYKKFRRANIQ